MHDENEGKCRIGEGRRDDTIDHGLICPKQKTAEGKDSHELKLERESDYCCTVATTHTSREIYLVPATQR